MMEVMWWITLGVVNGWIASLITRTHEDSRLLPYVGIGIAGALVGGLGARSAGLYSPASTPDTISLFAALMTSIAVLIAFSFFGETKAE